VNGHHIPFLAAIEETLGAAALRIDGFGRRRLYRAARAVRWGLALGQEAALRLSRGAIGELDGRLVRAAQATPVKAAIHYPGYWLPPATVTPTADALRRGEYLRADGTRAPLDRISWRRTRHATDLDVTWELFQALHWVQQLIEAHAITGDADYLRCARELADRWTAECAYTERADHVWERHVTGLRAIVLCRLWVAYREAEPEGSPFAARLLAAIARHGEKLAPPHRYQPDHNHGLAQAYGLFAIGVLFPALPKAAGWMELGRSRLEAQMQDNVSCDGLHREHSPYYQFFVFQQLYHAYRLGEACGVSFSSAYVERLDRMFAASAHLVKPNGALPTLGDTWRTAPILLEASDIADWPGHSAQEYLWSLSRGREGNAPAATSVLWEDGGLAVLRSGWGRTERWEDERALAVRLTTFDTAHIHRDLLSFELYGYGDDLIVDSGGPYIYGHPVRLKYFLSTAAHNTVLVDEENQETGAARVVHWSTARGVDVLVAEHETIRGVTHRRAMLFVRGAYLVVVDRLTGRRPHRYSQLFHLNPALEVRLHDGIVSTAHAAGGPTVRMVALGGSDLVLRLHRGMPAPRQGWVCVAPREMVPNTVVDYERSGAAATFAVIAVPEAPGWAAPVTAEFEGRLLETDARIRVRIGERVDELSVSAEGEVQLVGGVDGR
jgi:hypothetical protein